MEFSEIDKKPIDLAGDEFVAVLSRNMTAALKIIIFLINNGFTVIPLNPALTGKKISRYLSAINCRKIVSDENMPAGFDYDCRIFNMEDMDSIEKSCLDFRKIRNIFQNIGTDYKRKTSIIFTSGSTGMPKAALHTLESHYYSSLGSNRNIKFNEKDKWLIVLPFHHISGLSIIFRAALGGGEIAVKEPGMEISDALKTSKPTHISLVPHQLQHLLNDGKNIDILKKMKAVLLGGAGAPVTLIEQSYKYGLNLFVSYGSTEMCSQITCTKNKDTLEHLKTSGQLLEYRKIKISEKNNILVKGRTLFAGYIIKNKYDNRISVKKKLDTEGYFDTGDNGYLDDEGYLHITGRKDISFKYKAEKIYPEEIEKVFLNINGVCEAIVVPYKKNDLEKIPVIFLKTDSSILKDLRYIRKKAKEELEPYKFPAYFMKWPYDSHVLKPSRKEMQKTAQEIIKKEIKEKLFD